MAMVKMKHLESELEVSVLPSQVENMRRTGWVPVEEKPEKSKNSEVRDNG